MKLILTRADGGVIYASAGVPVHHRVIDMRFEATTGIPHPGGAES